MGIETEREQLGNFIESYNDETINNTKGLCNLVVRGMYTVAPEEVKSSDFLNNPAKVEVANALLSYQIALNDLIDFSHSNREDIGDIVKYLKEREIKQKITLGKKLEKLGSVETSSLIENAVKETELIEKNFHLFKNEPSFDDVEQYRNMVNAISNYVLSALILGEDKFSDKMSTGQEATTYDDIFNKYKWLVNGEYSNNSQRVVVIMHKLVMSSQIYDDWVGKDIDKQLGTESFFTAAMREKKDNIEETKIFLTNIKKSYEREARELGIGFLPQKGFDFFQKTMQDGMHWVTKISRFSNIEVLKGWAANIVIKNLGARERLYAQEII